MASAFDSRVDVSHGGVGPFAFAFAASIAFHVLVLWFAAGLGAVPLPQVSLPLVARLVTVRPPPAAPVASAAVVAPATLAEARSASREPVRRAPRAASATPALRPAQPHAEPAPRASVPSASRTEPAPPPVEAPTRVEASPLVEASPPVVRPAKVARSAPRIAASAPEVPDGGGDSILIAQYRSGLIATAQRYRKYPHRAIENNWEGRADVRVAIAANGAADSISLLTRSGYEVLDRQALQMIRKARRDAPMPPALRGKAFMLDIPVLFNLKDETG